MRSILLILLLASPAFSQGIYGQAESLLWRGLNSDFSNVYDTNLEMDHDWSVGFRAGVGFQHPCGWRASWMYTSYGADDSRIWTDVNVPGDSYSSYGDLDYQVHDFEFGRVYCLDQVLQVEAFAGFRWGQIDYTVRDAVGGAPGNVLQMDSNTDSYGLRVGGKARCYLPGQFSIFGEGAITGMLSTTENRGSTQVPDASWDVTDNHENHAVDAAAGISWEQGILEISAGYEWNWWDNSIQRRSMAAQPDYEDLLLEGVFFRFVAKY